MIIDAHATDTVPSHEVRQRANEALANAGEPMSEVTYDALRKRIAELEEALQKQEAITKEDVKWMMAYHQWCVMNGCPPSSSDLIAAHDALTGGKKDE